MKRRDYIMKKFMQLTLVLAMSFFCLSSVKAATKEEVIAYAEQNAPTEYAEQVKRYLNTYSADPDKLDTVLANGKEIVKIMKEANVKDPKNLTPAQKANVKSFAIAAADAVEATINYDPATGMVSVLDPNGEVFTKMPLPTDPTKTVAKLRPTGNDCQVYVAFSGLAVVAAATALYRKLKTNA